MFRANIFNTTYIYNMYWCLHSITGLRAAWLAKVYQHKREYKGIQLQPSTKELLPNNFFTKMNTNAKEAQTAQCYKGKQRTFKVAITKKWTWYTLSNLRLQITILILCQFGNQRGKPYNSHRGGYKPGGYQYQGYQNQGSYVTQFSNDNDGEQGRQ